MLARTIKARDLCVGDHLLLPKGWVEVRTVIFDDKYAGNGVWFTEQTEGTYAWPPADQVLAPDDLVVVMR